MVDHIRLTREPRSGPRQDAVGPRPARHPLRSRIGGGIAGLVVFLLLLATSYVTVRPALLNYVSTTQEQQSAMPGDDIVARADTVMTRSATLPAPPQAVWPWLVQMGVGRGGFYGYDWLENTFGDRVSNATDIHDEWQDLRSGGQMSPMPGQQWAVPILRPNHTLVIGSTSWSWSLTLNPVGQNSTRLVT